MKHAWTIIDHFGIFFFRFVHGAGRVRGAAGGRGTTPAAGLDAHENRPAKFAQEAVLTSAIKDNFHLCSVGIIRR